MNKVLKCQMNNNQEKRTFAKMNLREMMDVTTYGQLKYKGKIKCNNLKMFYLFLVC